MREAAKRILLILAIAMASIVPSLAQDNIFVQITVTDASGKPLRNVNMSIESVTITNSDVDGQISASVARNATLLFSLSGYNNEEVNVNNRQQFTVRLSEKSVDIDAVVVQIPKFKSKVVQVEPTEIEVVGNYLRITPKFTMPVHLFGASKRFIFQPTLVNVTRNSRRYFRPVVVDGDVMSANYLRLNEFDVSDDPLQDYIIDMHITRDNNHYAYKDSLYIDKQQLDDDFKSECFLIITETFANEKRDYRDTLIIGEGTRNPLRFLDYKFAPIELNDSTLIPKPVPKLVSEVGTSNIKFVVGRSEIDAKDENNKREFEQIENKLQKILSNPYASMRGIAVTGYASPEGTFATNQSLAKNRTALILNTVSKSLTAEQRKFVKLTSNSKVEPWSRVAEIADPINPELAAKVREITTKYNDNYDKSQYEIRRLPDYRTKIMTQYLPALRRVEYELDYSVFRNLTDKEIRAMYFNKDTLNRYEHWRLVESAENDKEKVEFEDATLKKFPNLELVANRVAIRMLQSDSLNLGILEPCIMDGAPMEIIHNQAIIAIGLRELGISDSLVNVLPQNDSRFDYVRAISNAFIGNYAEALEVMAPAGGLNEVLLLLAMNEDKTAYEKVKLLVADPMNAINGKIWYIFATCANRLDDMTWAIIGLQNALMYDPSLVDFARIDSDVLDLLEIVAPELSNKNKE